MTETSAQPDPGTIAGTLLDWYDRHHRELPWRTPPHARTMPDPYHVWLSEVMLQQTTVEAVKPFFRKFLALWPDVAALAAADTDDVMKAWAGLGYYSRARNLKKCAEAVVTDHGGRFPDTEGELRSLPGIGDYTAAAIAAIAFDRPSAVMDGNIERVTARLFAVDTPLPAAKPILKAHVSAMTPQKRSGDFAQAMMDLGATICTPRRPACVLCPLREDCLGLALGDPALLPVKVAKAERPQRKGAAFVAMRADGAVLLRKRGETGLLGGMAEVPTTAWTARTDGGEDISHAPFSANWRACGTIGHVFTHFALELAVFRAEVTGAEARDGEWWSHDLQAEALPTVMKKVVEAAIPGSTRTRETRTEP